jgi:hypothetical protein
MIEANQLNEKSSEAGHSDYSIQCGHGLDHAYRAKSDLFTGTACYEFASLGWIAEAVRPSIAKMEAVTRPGPSSAECASRDDRSLAFSGKRDPCLEKFGLA